MNIKKAIEKHKKYSQDNNLFVEYFSDRMLFHDCTISDLMYDAFKKRLIITIDLSLYPAFKNSKNSKVKLVFSRVLEITFGNFPWNLVDLKAIDNVNWKNFLSNYKDNRHLALLYILFGPSKHKEFVSKYLETCIHEAKIIFDNEIGIALSFMKLTVELPEGLSKKKMIKLHEEYWSQ